MRIFNGAILAPILTCAISGCVAPGSSIGHVSIRGSLTYKAGAPLGDREVQFILPAAYGLGGLDLVLNEPEDFGHQDHSFSTTTDASGHFAYDLGDHIYHISFWLIPPLGGFPRYPPPPFLLVRVPDFPGEYYAVQTGDGRFKAFTLEGNELPLADAQLSAVFATSESGSTDGTRWTVGIIDLEFDEN